MGAHILLAMAMVALFPQQGFGQGTVDAAAAADKLREGHVLRTFQTCKQKGESDDACKRELENLLKRDNAALARIAEQSDTSDKTELIIAAARCYDPSFDYEQLIECREAIADDLENRQQLADGGALLSPAESTSPDVPAPTPERIVVAEPEEPRATLVATIPPRKPRRFVDLDWVTFINQQKDVAAKELSDLAICDSEPLRVTLPIITNETTVRDSFWRPVNGDLPTSDPEIDSSSGLNILKCSFRSLARANLMFHEDDETIFRIDIYFRLHQCDDLNDTTCLRKATTEKMSDIDLYLSAGNPTTLSAFGSSAAASENYLTRYADLLDDIDSKRRLSWSNCGRLRPSQKSTYEAAGLSPGCVVNAVSQDGEWRSVSFLHLATANQDESQSAVHLASKMTFANERAEREKLDRHRVYFETLVAGRLVSMAKEIAPPEKSEVIQEVSVAQQEHTKPEVDLSSAGTIDRRTRMKAVLKSLIGLSP